MGAGPFRVPRRGLHDEAAVTVDGALLSTAQVACVRVAVSNMLWSLQDEESREMLGPIAEHYESRLREVEELLCTKLGG